MALRSNARSIRASVTTGYCGAIRSMVASIVSGERQEGVTRSGDQPDADPDAPVRHLGRDRGAGKERTPGGAPSTDPGDAGNLEGGESDHLGDDALADAQLRAAHEADSRVG